jgi:2'-5' RNA ligase
VRLFFALWPPPVAARALADWASAVAHGTGGKPTPAERIHLTLAFLGEADPERAALGAQEVHGEAFDLPLEISQYWKHNQIVWAGPRRTPEPLDRLASGLHHALRRAGFVLEPRPFASHVTLVRKARRPHALPDLPAVHWPAREFLLVESRNSREGLTYTPLHSFPWAARSGPC